MSSTSKQASKSIVHPTTIDGIEFYVSHDGKESGVSQIGLSRLCEVDEMSIRRLIDSVRHKTAPKSLETLHHKSLHLDFESTNNAKVVPSDVAAIIIEYYAFDSKAANETARFSLRKFATKGIDTWIKEVVGYSQEGREDMLMSAMQELLTEMKGLREDSKALRDINTQVKEREMEGMKTLMEEFAAYPEGTLAPDEKAITLTEWLEAKGITLDKSKKHRFANLVAQTYRTITKREPRCEMRPTKIMVFTILEYPILQIALNKLMA